MSLPRLRGSTCAPKVLQGMEFLAIRYHLETRCMPKFATDWRAINTALSTIEDTYHVTLAVDDVGERPTINSIYRATARHAWTS